MLKNIILKYSLSLFLVLFISIRQYPQSTHKDSAASSDTLKIYTQYSLFSEYYKNKDYVSAIPFGWNIINMNPKKFSDFIYFKMEDAFWHLHDSTQIAPKLKKSIADTMDYFYNLAIKYDPSSKGYFEARKAYVDESWLKLPVDTVIKEYEQAIKDDSTISSYYYDQLGQLYKNNASDKNDYKNKALGVYTYLSEREPNNPQWNTELEGLAENIKQLAELRKKAWDMDKNNLAKAWDYAVTAIKAGLLPQAENVLEFLTNKVPGNVNYWVQLASVYQKANNLDKAEEAYKQLIKLKPDNKDYYLNLGIVYKDKGNLAKAREEYLKASDVAKGWGLAIYYVGNLYELAASKCDFNFDTKKVYLLAVETYKKALSIDPSLVQAKERITALASSVPTKEDYFFRGFKAGQSLPISGSCYGWINRNVTVP